MRRHVRRVEIDQLEPLVVAHIGLTPELNVFRHPSSATPGVYKHIAARKPTCISSRKGTSEGVKPLECHAFGEPAFDLYLGRMGVRIPGAIQTDKIPILVAAQQVAIGGRRQPGAKNIIVFRLSCVELELLLEIAPMISHITEPEGRFKRQLALDADVPRLGTGVSPVAGVPDGCEGGAARDLNDSLGIDGYLANKVSRARLGYERVLKRIVHLIDLVCESEIQGSIVPGRLQDL